ncbi:MAG: hypothetical protein ACRD0G_14250 [Acidimicrobiales bacterium]
MPDSSDRQQWLRAATRLLVVSRPEAGGPSYAGSPWSWTELRRLGTLVGVGLVALAVSWRATSDRVAVDDQILWLNIAVLGVMAAGLANLAFLLRAYRTVRARRVRMLAEHRRPSAAAPDPVAAATAEPLVAAPAMTRFHRVGCPFVQGKDVSVAERDHHAAAGRRPCPWCQP